MLEDARGAIAYDEEGSGPTILFVPGSWATGSAWRGVADMRTGFDPPLSAHADLSVPMLILKGDRTHPALARSAEILSHAAPNASLVTVAGADHFMIATHASDVAKLVAGHISKSGTPE
jgi:pimeloyl-ACP methyl ester carboxylesterase